MAKSASRTFTIPLAILLSLALLATTESQSPASAPSSFPTPVTAPTASAPAPALDCTNDLLNLSSCLTYVEAGSNLTVPDKGCCPSLANLVNNNPICLCQLLSSGSNPLGLQIDTTKALMLPTACKVDTPPVSLCSAIGIPVASPMETSPAPAMSGGPNQPGSSASTISNIPAAAPGSSSSGNSIAKEAISLVAVVNLFIIALF